MNAVSRVHDTMLTSPNSDSSSKHFVLFPSGEELYNYLMQMPSAALQHSFLFPDFMSTDACVSVCFHLRIPGSPSESLLTYQGWRRPNKTTFGVFRGLKLGLQPKRSIASACAPLNPPCHSFSHFSIWYEWKQATYFRLKSREFSFFVTAQAPSWWRQSLIQQIC